VLSRDCAAFRRRFEPGSGSDPHRSSCPDCAAYADLLEEAETAASLALPPRLEERLRAIPAAEGACHEVLASWLRGDSLTDAQSSHLGSCPLCARGRKAFIEARQAPPMPLPTALAFRLRHIGRRPVDRSPLPLVIRRARYAVAASLLLATVATQAFAAFRRPLLGAGSEVVATASGVAGEGRAQGQAWVRRVLGEVRSLAGEGREHLQILGERLSSRLSELPFEIDLRPSGAGADSRDSSGRDQKGADHDHEKQRP
jgi:hypothetical protein